MKQPVKLRKLNGWESVVEDLWERATQEQLVDQVLCLHIIKLIFI